MKTKVLILIILFVLCNLSFLPSQAKDTSLSSHTISFNDNNVSFSLKTNYGQSSINIYSIYSDYNSFHISNTTGSMANNSYITSSSITIPISNIVSSYYSILDENYFISNNSRFIAVSTFSNINNNYNLTIKNLHTNKTLLEQGQSPYKIALINSFDNSSDVYFTFYNETMFTIAKYSFQNNNFTIYEHSKNLSYNDYFISMVNVFFLNNKIYSSFVITDNTSTTPTQSSRVLISNMDNIVFNKTFPSMSIDFITPSSLGFLFHSYQNSKFYDYRFSSNNYIQIPTFIPAIDQLKPFDNNSFIIITNQILLCSFKVSQTSSVIYFNESYNLQNINYNKKLVAFTIASGSYYILGMPDSGAKYTISIFNKNEIPTNIMAVLTTTISLGTTNPLPQSTSTIPSSNNTGSLLILLLIILVAIGLIVFDKRKDRKNQYKPRDEMFQNTSKYQNQNVSTQKQNPILTRFCVECGSPVTPDDVFCQNCGRRI